jgi:type II secretory pathway pseudopilin PulG
MQIRMRGKHFQGFTLLETVFALIIFAMMGLVFSAVLPVSLRGARMNSHYAQAAALAQHKIAQIRAAGFASAQNPATLAGLGILDSGSATSLAVPYTAGFTASDHLGADSAGNGIYPAGTTATVAVTDYAALNPSVPAGTVDCVTVTVQWPQSAVSGGSYTLSGLIIQSPHS